MNSLEKDNTAIEIFKVTNIGGDGTFVEEKITAWSLPEYIEKFARKSFIYF